ncbi:response regulator [Collimonas arenae]|uniref:response regulator n=1 Tax=Collimonas arenae TaxID=279058 RepID=UPI0007784239|nr:response regulator [Collimonas arenae]
MIRKKILFVEDDEPKLEQVLALLETFTEIEVIVAKSLNGACKCIDREDYDLVLLDMSLPTFDNGMTVGASGRQKTFGGREILMYLWENEKDLPVLVLTQFKDFPGDEGPVNLPQLHAQLKKDFPGLYRDHIYFEHNNDAWKTTLTNLLCGIMTC